MGAGASAANLQCSLQNTTESELTRFFQTLTPENQERLYNAAGRQGCETLESELDKNERPQMPHIPSEADAEMKRHGIERTPTNYAKEESVWAALSSDDVRLLSGQWLAAYSETDGAVLPRRQECPKEAFLDLDTLKRIHEKSQAIPCNAAKRMPVVGISHSWRKLHHPDAQGTTLRLVGGALRKWLKVYEQGVGRDEYGRVIGKCGVSDVGVFIDWASLFQEPRTELETASFKRSLQHINVWYAHALTTVYLVTETEEGMVPYMDRGWTSFEYQLSCMIKLSDQWNAWPQIVHLNKEQPELRYNEDFETELWKGGSPRAAPMAPNAFEEGNICGQKIFTNGADREFVARKFHETVMDVYGEAIELFYEDVGWGDAELDALDSVLPFCKKLEHLSLCGNPFTQLPSSIFLLPQLEKLVLHGCSNLEQLPDEVRNLKKLQYLDVRDCCAAVHHGARAVRDNCLPNLRVAIAT